MQRLSIEVTWTEAREAHIARHGVTTTEVDEVLGGPVVLKRGKLGRYCVYGVDSGGRYLCVVLERDDTGEWFCVTARPMVANERRLYGRGGK